MVLGIQSGSCGDGYVWPDLWFLPLERKIELEWHSYRAQFSRVDFLATGSVIIERESVLSELERIVDACISRLAECGITASNLHAEWAAISSLTEDEIQFARASAAFGLDPFFVPARQAEGLLAASELGDERLVADVLTASRGLDLKPQVQWLSKRIADVRRLEGSLAALPDMKSVTKGLPKDLPPHEQGYWVANQLRSALDINGHPIRGSNKPSLADLTKIFGAEDWRGAISLRFDHRQPIQAISVGDTRPRFGINKPRKDSQRFLLARAVYGQLVDANEDVGIVATSDSLVDRAGRSFAAEFLAPAEGLRKRVSGAAIDEFGIAELAAEFGVSELVVKHQLENHQIAVVA